MERKLLEILEEELALLDELIALMRKEGEIVASLDVEKIDGHLIAKSRLVERIRMLDGERETLLNRWGVSGMTLKEVAREKGGNFKVELLSLAGAFRDKLDELCELNRANSILIEKSLLYVTSSFKFLDNFGISPQQRVSLEA